jgi:hypothetical protein
MLLFYAKEGTYGRQQSEVSHVEIWRERETVRSVIKRVGNSRKKVYAALDKM